MARVDASKSGGRRGPRVAGRHVLFGAAVCGLVAVAVWAAVIERRLDGLKDDFSIERYRSVLKRVDTTVEAIGDRLAFEGLVEAYDGVFAAASAVELEGEEEQAEEELTPRVRDAGPAAPRTLKLTGVIWRESGPLAVVNGKLVGVDEQIEGMKIVRIGAESITVADEAGNRRDVELYESVDGDKSGE